MQEFVPETELERAYIQSTSWESHRLWRRARVSAEQEQWAFAAGLNVSRVLDCALNGRKSTLIRTLESINFVIGKLDEPQKVSLFKCLAHLVNTLLENDFVLENQYVSVILQLMLRLFFRAGELRGADIVAMMRLLHDIYGGPHWLAAFSFLACESGQPMAPTEILNDIMTDAQKVFFTDSPAAKDPKTADPPRFATGWRVMNEEEASRKKARKEEKEIGEAAWENDIPSCSKYGNPKDYSLPAEISASELSGASTYELLSLLHQDMVKTVGQYGFRSPETAKALIRLAHFSNQKNLVSVNQYLSDLTDILEDESVEVHEYDLRRLYAITGKVQGDEQLVSVAEQLQRIIFSRREKLLGYDMSMVLPLTRLIALWNATGRLAEGQAFCELILNGVSKEFSEHDIVVRQIKSVYERVSKLHSEKAVPQIESGPAERVVQATLNSDLYEEPEEFVSMLAIVAMDHFQNDRKEQAELVLQEALAYYFECTSDIARRVGEMLWLLVETDLRSLKGFREKLIELSIPKAFDDYLQRQFVKNFGRMLKLLNEAQGSEVISVASRVSLELVGMTGLKSGTSAPFWYRLLSQGSRDEVFDVARFQSELNDINTTNEGKPSGLSLSRANYLGDKLSEHFLSVGELVKAREIITDLLNIGTQTKVDVTKLLTRLARIHIAEDNICDAIAILYLAFSDLPSPYDQSDPDEQPLVLNL